MKLCPQCGLVKAFDDFYTRSKRSGRLFRDCKTCVLAQRKSGYVAHPRVRTRMTRAEKYLPCDVCAGPTWVQVSSGSATARHRRCLPVVAHGTQISYMTRRCRCAECRAWKVKDTLEYRRKRRDAGNPLPKNYKWINASTRLAIYERDGWVCQLCFDPLDRDSHFNDNWGPSVDHVIPQSQGGSDGIENLRAAHRWCNSVRGDGKYHADLFVTEEVVA